MEVFVAQAKEQLMTARPEANGSTPLHCAAAFGHTALCSLLAAEVLVCCLVPSLTHCITDTYTSKFML